MVSEVCHEVHMTPILHTASISNVDGVMFINRIKEMVWIMLNKSRGLQYLT